MLNVLGLWRWSKPLARFTYLLLRCTLLVFVEKNNTNVQSWKFQLLTRLHAVLFTLLVGIDGLMSGKM